MQKIHRQKKLFIANIKITEMFTEINYYSQYFKANINNIKNTWKY